MRIPLRIYPNRRGRLALLLGYVFLRKYLRGEGMDIELRGVLRGPVDLTLVVPDKMVERLVSMGIQALSRGAM